METVLKLGIGRMVVDVLDGEQRLYSEFWYCLYCDLDFFELMLVFFSFNFLIGACFECNGLGMVF